MRSEIISQTPILKTKNLLPQMQKTKKVFLRAIIFHLTLNTKTLNFSHHISFDVEKVP